MNGIQEVVGSIPIISTKEKDLRKQVLFALYVQKTYKKCPRIIRRHFSFYQMLSSTILTVIIAMPTSCIFVNRSLNRTAEQTADMTRIAPFSTAA